MAFLLLHNYTDFILFFHGLLHPHYADNLYYLSNH